MKKIFEKLRIGNMVLDNRILRSATWEALSDEAGMMSDEQYHIYRELAESGIGLICTGYARVVEDDTPNAAMMGIYSDDFIPSCRKLTDMVHSLGTKIMMQIAYGGTKTNYRVGERTIFAPSDVPDEKTGTIGTPMTEEDIEGLVRAYGDAARRVRESGFDAVQIHGGHGYLLNQFLSPHCNTRTDRYGGSFENRIRIILEILDAVKDNCGDLPVLIKLTCTDFTEDGFSFDDCLSLCRILEERGMDAIEISGNIHGKAESMAGQIFEGRTLRRDGYFGEFGKEVADAVDIPVFVTGGFRDPDTIEDYLNSTKAAGTGLCRPLLCEADLVKKWASGDRKKARCIHCSRCRTKEGNYCTVFNKKQR